MEMRIAIRERGPTPRKLKKAMTACSKSAWKSTATLFHSDMRDKRFSHSHAREAGYKKRRGQEYPFGSKGFWNSYTGTKWRKYKHTNPLQYSGETRGLVKTASMSNPTSKGIRVGYPGARKLNWRNKNSQIRMADEFRLLLPREKVQLAANFDNELDRKMNADQTTETRIL